MNKERGFTLIELLTVIAIIGMLAVIGTTSFNYYKASAAYASIETTLRNAKTDVVASTFDPENSVPAVPLTEQDTQGPIEDPLAAQYLPSLQLPPRTVLQTSYDPDCETADCVHDYVQLKHCWANAYTQWTRFGDGVEVTLEHVEHNGCE